MITDKIDYLEFYEADKSCSLKEEIHQVNCMAWFKYTYPIYIVWHTTNEGKKTMNQALLHEQAGLLKGVSDFVILIGPCHKYPFAAIELKRTNKSGKAKASPVSDEQRDFLRRVRERGGFSAVAYGEAQFKIAVEYLFSQH